MAGYTNRRPRESKFEIHWLEENWQGICGMNKVSSHNVLGKSCLCSACSNLATIAFVVGLQIGIFRWNIDKKYGVGVISRVYGCNMQCGGIQCNLVYWQTSLNHLETVIKLLLLLLSWSLGHLSDKIIHVCTPKSPTVALQKVGVSYCPPL